MVKSVEKKKRKATMLFYLACLHEISYFRVCGGYIRGWCYEFSRFIRLQNDLIAGWSV